jgi:hypothetical protein
VKNGDFLVPLEAVEKCVCGGVGYKGQSWAFPPLLGLKSYIKIQRNTDGSHTLIMGTWGICPPPPFFYPTFPREHLLSLPHSRIQSTHGLGPLSSRCQCLLHQAAIELCSVFTLKSKVIPLVCLPSQIIALWLEHKCPQKAHVLKAWSPGWCYQEVVEPLRGWSKWEVIRSLGMGSQKGW